MRNGPPRFRREEDEEEVAVEFDWATFEELCQNQCTRAEICAAMGLSAREIDDYTRGVVGGSFEDVQKSLALVGKANIRRHQMCLSKYNANMAIFMGKVYLNQSDGPESSGQVMGILDNIRGINVVAGRPKPVDQASG